MKLKKNHNLSLDKFINLSLYSKKFGYYMKKDSFGEKGDFITSPNISRLFSEMIGVWIISFWNSLGSPKKFNLIELGAGNGEMMKILIESFRNFPTFLSSCNFIIIEKSPTLIKIQKKKLKGDNVKWIDSINSLKKKPSIFVANEFFDAIPIKQFIKLNRNWFEIYVGKKNDNKPFFFNKKIDMKKFEKKIKFEISYNQNFIEYSKVGLDYLEKISKFIKKNKGGILIIDYGYFENQMKDTIQSVSKQKYSNILENIGNCDITHNINFKLFKKIIKKIGGLKDEITTQKEFLIKLGIKQRAEIISKNLPFSKKTSIFFRLKRLIDNKQMGNHFKVMLIKNKNNKFKLGF
mgnify:CR=1 FL=1